MPGIELKINVRHSNTGGKIRTITHFTNFTLNQTFNATASTFSFDFYFDPRNKEHAEIVCVSHMHECQIYYNGKLVLTGFVLSQKFTDNGKPQLVSISGYSKAGVIGDCDIPPELYPLEINGLTLNDIIRKVIAPFGLKLVVKGTSSAKKFVIDDNENTKTVEGVNGEEVEIPKSASDTSQNIAAYITDLAKQRNVVLSHDENGNVLIPKVNTNGTPIFNFDFTKDENGSLTNTSPDNDAFKIPGVECELEFNGQALHTHITAMQQADDNEETNASQFTIRNPLIPIGRATLYRPKVITVSSGNDNTVSDAAAYELGREIREGVVITIKVPRMYVGEDLIKPNNTITIKNPRIFLYNKCTLFIQSIVTSEKPNEESSVLSCVLPYGYDYDLKALKNVFVDPHENLPRF